MMLALWLVEFFEPPARKLFELRLKTSDAAEFRAKAEDVLKALRLEHELLVEDEDEIRYSVSAPVDVRTKDVSDTLRLVAGGNVVVRWEEKKSFRCRSRRDSYSFNSTIVAPPPPWLSGAA